MIVIRTIILSCFLSIGLFTSAQEIVSKKNIKKSSQLLAAAMQKLDQDDLLSAEKLIIQSTHFNPYNKEAIIALADIKMQQKDYFDLVKLLEKILTLDPSQEKILIHSLFKAYLGIGAFDDARKKLFIAVKNQSIDSVKYFEYLKWIDFSSDVSQKNKLIDLKVKNLGTAVNSKLSEYFPSVSYADTMLIMTRRINNGQNEDFFVAVREGRSWKSAVPLSGKINTVFNEGGQKISSDGNLMVFTGCNYPEGTGSCDLYYALSNNGTWGERMHFETPINTEYWESAPCLSADKKTLYFSSNRPGGFGGMDIYKSNLKQNGHWTEPENLGAAINTSGDEMFPFIHFDQSSLYFTSNGWKSLGGSDLFVSRKIGNSFTPPINLGFPINTIDNESGMVVSANGREAYFSSDRFGGEGEMDIYSFELPIEVQAFPVKQSEKIVLHNIQFETAKSEIKPDSEKTLNVLLQFLRENPHIQIQINGHTDNIGREEDNILLSNQRAKAVVDFLVKNGIQQNRLSYKGFGSSQPIADNETELGRAFNRRTEMVILTSK